jgi:hypothetical protein
LINELQFLAKLLDQVKRNEEAFGPHDGTREALALCLEPLESLNSIAQPLDLGVTSKRKLKRKWAAIEMVMSNEKLGKFKLKLQESKSNLMLALQLSSVWVMITCLVSR